MHWTMLSFGWCVYISEALILEWPGLRIDQKALHSSCPTIADKNAEEWTEQNFMAFLCFSDLFSAVHQLCPSGQVTYAVEWRQSGTSGAGSSCKSFWHKVVAQMACFGCCFRWLMKTFRVLKVVMQCQSPQKYI